MASWLFKVHYSLEYLFRSLAFHTEIVKVGVDELKSVCTTGGWGFV